MNGALVIRITPPDGAPLPHRRVTGDLLRIGRAYDCDILLDDPHVDPHHATLRRTGDGWEIADNGSLNGTLLNGRALAGGAARVAHDDRVTLGRSTLQLLDPAAAVTPALRLEAQSRLLAFFTAPAVAWPLFAIAVAAAAGNAWLEVWNDNAARAMSAASALSAGAIIGWAAIFALAGRILRGQARFTAQAGIASTYMVFSALVWHAQRPLDVITSEGAAAEIFSYAATAVTFYLLLSASLSLATVMPRARRRMAAALFALGCIAGLYAIDAINAARFNPQPAPSTVIARMPEALLPATGARAFLDAATKNQLKSNPSFKKAPVDPAAKAR